MIFASMPRLAVHLRASEFPMFALIWSDEYRDGSCGRVRRLCVA